MPDDLPPSELSTSLDEVSERRALLRVTGEIDLLTAPRLAAALEGVVAPHRVVVVDLGAVEFMDSTGLRTLLTARRRAHESGGGLVVDAPAGGPAARLLDLAGVRDLFVEDAGGASGA